MNTFHKKQLIGLIITALSLQGILSLVGYWGLYQFQFYVLWAIRAFLAYELFCFFYNFWKKHDKLLPMIGHYSDRVF